MVNPWRPRLGEWVLFGQFLEKLTAADFEAATKAELGRIEVKYATNPKPESPAMVVGVVSKRVEAYWADPPRYGGEPEGEGRFLRDITKRRTFYVLKRTIRGRRFLVPIEDLSPVAHDAKIDVSGPGPEEIEARLASLTQKYGREAET